MDFGKLGNFILLAGLIALGAAGYYYYSVNSAEFEAQMANAAARRAWGSSSGFRDGVMHNAMQERAESKALIFGSVGGLLMLVGLGMKSAAKKNSEG